MKINCEYKKLVDVELLAPNPRNANTHSEKQIQMLAKIIEHTGWRHPIIVSNRSKFVVAGHARLEAAKLNGYAQVPVDYQDFSSEAEEFQFLIADNKIAELATHDDTLMIDGIKDLELGDLDFELMGLLDFEMLEADPAKDEIEDDVPTNVDTRCKPGDLWELGDHRLLCGDATNIQHVDKLMDGAKADITFTSPPYNIGSGIKENGKYENYDDNKSPDDYRDFLSSFVNNCLIASDYVFSNIQSIAGNKVALIEHLYDMRERYADTIIWDKESAQPAMARKVLNSQFEYIHIFSNEAKRSIGKRDFRGTLTNVFKLNSRAGKEYAKVHKATFRVELPQYFLENFSESSCMDPFGGTGSTLIACEKTNRKCFMMELDPHYCDVILKRWEQYADKKATLTTQELN